MTPPQRTYGPDAAELLELAADGRPRPAIEFILGLLDDGVAVDDLITEVLAAVQLEAGRRWVANEWSIADEHAASAVIDGALGALALQTPVPEVHRGKVLVACAEGEHHTMPARMGAERLRCDGWDVTFLGGSLPADDLQRYAGVTEPDLVVVSCTVPLYLAGARRCFAAVAELGVPAFAAGAAFGSDGARAKRLGASGWIDPAASLTSALDQMQAPEISPTPPEASALELAADDLRRSCLSELVEGVPQLAESAPQQMASARTDIADILGYLVTSIDLADDDIFLDHISQLAHLLEVRGMSTEVLHQSLDIIGRAVASAGMTDAARLCAAQQATDTKR